MHIHHGTSSVTCLQSSLCSRLEAPRFGSSSLYMSSHHEGSNNMLLREKRKREKRI